MNEKELNKKNKIIVDHLYRIFPHLKLYYEGEYFENEVPSGKKLTDVEKISQFENDFAHPRKYDWFDILKILDENGMEINWKDKT